MRTLTLKVTSPFHDGGRTAAYLCVTVGNDPKYYYASGRDVVRAWEKVCGVPDCQCMLHFEETWHYVDCLWWDRTGVAAFHIEPKGLNPAPDSTP